MSREDVRNDIAKLVNRKVAQRKALRDQIKRLDAELEALERAWIKGDATQALKAMASITEDL